MGENAEKNSKYFIIKEEINEELWIELQEKFKGNEDDIKYGIQLFFDNYKYLPYEANEYILDCAKPETSVEIIKLIAEYVEKEETKLPASFEIKLLYALKENKDEEVNEIIKDKLKKYEEMMNNLMQNLINFNEYYKQVGQNISKIFTESIQKVSSSLFPFQKVISEVQIQQREMFRNLSLTYYTPITFIELEAPEKVPEDTFEHYLIKKIQDCPKGKKGWLQFQNICGEVLEYLFSPPLGEPSSQDRTEGGVHIRDYIMQIPCNLTGFWYFCQMKYDVVGLVVEIKNKNELEENDVVIAAKYIHSKRIGNLGFIITREKIGENVLSEVERIWREDDKLLVVLTDDNLIEMIKLKQSGDEPEKVIEIWIFDFRSSLD